MTSHYIKRESNKMIIGTNSVDRLTIDNTGNVGIGVTNPTSQLETNDNIVTTGVTCTNVVNISGDIVNSSIPICCHARRDAGSVTTSSVIVFNKCDVNIGNDYNTSTGIFTCPSDGYYYVNAFAQIRSGEAIIYLRKNSTKIGSGALCNHNDIWHTNAFTHIVQCSTNDTLDIYFEVVSGSPYIYAIDTTETNQYHALNGLNIYKIIN